MIPLTLPAMIDLRAIFDSLRWLSSLTPIGFSVDVERSIVRGKEICGCVIRNGLFNALPSVVDSFEVALHTLRWVVTPFVQYSSIEPLCGLLRGYRVERALYESKVFSTNRRLRYTNSGCILDYHRRENEKKKWTIRIAVAMNEQNVNVHVHHLAVVVTIVKGKEIPRSCCC